MMFSPQKVALSLLFAEAVFATTFGYVIASNPKTAEEISNVCRHGAANADVAVRVGVCLITPGVGLYNLIHR